MIDFIKAVCYDAEVATKLRKDINTVTDVDTSDGLIITGIYKKKLRDFTITVYPSNRIELAGSFHKYSQYGHNYNDFNYPDCRQAIVSLCGMFGLKPANVLVTNLEIGVNIIPHFPVREFLRSIVGLNEGVPFNVLGTWGRECRRSEYRYKLYYKSLQTKLAPANQLRYELHFDKSRKFLPVKTLQDLCEIENWVRLADMLKAHFPRIIFRDSYLVPESNKQLTKFLQEHGQRIDNAFYWSELTRVDRCRSHKKLRELETYGQAQWQKNTARLISEKLDELLQVKRFHSLSTG